MASSAAGTGSPAERKIALAKEKLARDPKHLPARNDWALALTQRARETSDPKFYVQADEVVTGTLAIKPDDFEAHDAPDDGWSNPHAPGSGYRSDDDD